MNLRICFLAPSGYGKSTASVVLANEYGACIVKIAKPLYELQADFYKKLGMDIGEKQDGELLQFYGYKVRKENPNFLLECFCESVNMCEDAIIINDDCRPMDYEFLKNMGFVFVKINGYKRDREDHVKASDKSSLEWQCDIPYDYEVNNYGNMNEYIDAIKELVNNIKNDKYNLSLNGGIKYVR